MTKPYFTYGVTASDRDLITSTTMYSGVHKRYFSSLDAEIFIGGERILDINRIDFSYEEKKLPYYGFNSFVPSKIFVGQKIVQGTFVINFTESGYIAKLLQKIDASELSGEYDRIGQACSNENAPLFGKQFDILIGYGGYKVPNEASLNNTYTLIQGASINGFQQMLDTSGEPVMEMYSFMAKAIKFDGFTYPKKEVVEELPDEDDNTNIDKEDKWEVRAVESRLKHEVNELREYCNNHKKTLGLVIDVSHSKHKSANDKESHIYVDVVEQFNSSSKTKIEGNIVLTITDIQVPVNEVFELKLTKDTKGHYGTRVKEESTKAIVKKLGNPKQQHVSCNLDFNVILDGTFKSDNPSFKAGMRRGLNY